MSRARVVVPPGAWSRVVYLNVVTLRTRIPKLTSRSDTGTALLSNTGVQLYIVLLVQLYVLRAMRVRAIWSIGPDCRIVFAHVQFP